MNEDNSFSWQIPGIENSAREGACVARRTITPPNEHHHRAAAAINRSFGEDGVAVSGSRAGAALALDFAVDTLFDPVERTTILNKRITPPRDGQFAFLMHGPWRAHMQDHLPADCIFMAA